MKPLPVIRMLVGASTALLLLAGCDGGSQDEDLPPVTISDVDVRSIEMGGADVAGEDAGGDAGVDLGPVLELEAIPGASTYGIVGEPVVLDGSESTGAVEFEWDFGDGRGWEEPREEAKASVVYDEPGRYQAVLTVHGPDGDTDSAAIVVSITERPIYVPRQSTTVSIIPGTTRVAVVSPDSDEVTVVRKDKGTEEQFSLVRRLPTDDRPRTVASYEEWLVVACEGDDSVLFMRHDESGEVRRAFLPVGSRPYGVVATQFGALVTLRSLGQLARIEFKNGVPTVTQRIDVIEDARDVALLPDGRIVVSRWRSPSEHGEVAVVSADLQDVTTWTLQRDPQAASDTETGGVPSYLGPLAVSPVGGLGIVPSLQANDGQGLFLNGEPLTHEFTMRGVISFVDLDTGEEFFERRKQFDDRGFANVAIFSPRGDYLYVAMRGNRSIERYDVLQSVASGTVLDVGYAPRGLAVSDDNRFLFVDAYLSRKLVVYDVRDLSDILQPIAEIQIPTEEPLAQDVLRGKQLFSDAQDARITKDGYIACAHCHLEGLSDHRTWDFTERGEGLRNTISLVGRAGGDGPLHWSANFDEVQDFEHDIRGPFSGSGLMSDAQFMLGTRDEPLGDPKAGVSPELDALAAYVESLSTHIPSPYRDQFGELTDDAVAGKTIFESTEAGCTTCHSGPRLTDSGFDSNGEPILHDVGTITAASGGRLGGPLPGIDTPTLHGAWHSAPYLHDGSAETLRDVLTTRNPADEHGKTSHLTQAELEQLIAYLRSLDGRVD